MKGQLVMRGVRFIRSASRCGGGVTVRIPGPLWRMWGLGSGGLICWEVLEDGRAVVGPVSGARPGGLGPGRRGPGGSGRRARASASGDRGVALLVA